MKFLSAILASAILSVAVARPHRMEEGDPLPQTSRITAFVLAEDGTPSVECWEIKHLADTPQIASINGKTAQALTIASGSELEGIDVLTWPTFSPLWPPSSVISGSSPHAEWLDMSNQFSLFNIQGGLINFNFYAARFGAADDEDDWPDHTFSLENGDDWFYFEDKYTGSDEYQSRSDNETPFKISTISGTETEALRLNYRSQPKHKVLHKGGCDFTGIRTPAGSSSNEAGFDKHSPLTVQVNIKESL